MSVKKMNMPKQFGLRRLFVATTCIAIPFGQFGYALATKAGAET